jgi:hypothetical protein
MCGAAETCDEEDSCVEAVPRAEPPPSRPASRADGNPESSEREYGIAAADLASAAVLTCTGRGLLFTCLATRSRFLTDPRGTTNPADPGAILKLFGTPDAGKAVKP